VQRVRVRGRSADAPAQQDVIEEHELALSSGSLSFREMKEEDIPPVLDLYHQVFESLKPVYSYPIDADIFRTKILEHPDFDPAGSIVAEENGEIIGYVLAGARTHALSDGDHLAGCIACLIMVRPERRRRGVGHELMNRVREFARAKGKDVITNHANPASPFSFFNGLQENWTEAAGFFKAEGFRVTETSCTCRQNISDFEINEFAREKRKELEAEGYTIEPCGEKTADILVNAAASHYFYWHYDCLGKVKRIEFPFLETAFMSLRRENIYGPEDVIIAHKDGRVDAYVVMARNPGEEISYLGPMWTHPDVRAKGAGSVVLQEALRREKEIHGVKVVDLWCSEHNANNFYARNGFKIHTKWQEWEQRI
jgi:GNAT superfamily N-acetyltransferase